MKGALRQHSFSGYELRDYVAEAIDFLLENEPDISKLPMRQ